MNQVAKRTITGLSIGAAVVLFFLYCPLKALSPILLIVACLIQREFYQMIKPYEPVTWFGLIIGALWIILTAAFPGLQGMGLSIALGVFASIPAVFILATIVLFSPKYTRPISSIASTLLGFFYVPFLLSFFLRFVQLEPQSTAMFAMPETRAGFYTLLYLIAVAKFSDTGGFAFGVAFGKHKMCPAISPKKSWEGLLGSMVFASATTAIFVFIAQHYNWAEYSVLWKKITYTTAIPIGIIFAIVGTIGDLIESRFKREMNVKDSGKLVKADIGGFLDMFDSFIFIPALVYPIQLYLGWCIK